MIFPKSIILSSSLLIILLGVTNLCQAGVASYGPGNCDVSYNGTITSATPVEIETLFDNLASKGECKVLTSTLYLNSNGGDLEAAIKTGEFIRSKNAYTMIEFEKSCMSSCVFIFLGGVERFNLGTIGLHRPYSMKMSSSLTESANSYEKINSLIKQYLKKMNIPEELLNEMNSISVSDVRLYKFYDKEDVEQLRRLHITGADPVWQDLRYSEIARKKGITKQEYINRTQRVETVCGNGKLRPPDGININAYLKYSERHMKCVFDVLDGKR